MAYIIYINCFCFHISYAIHITCPELPHCADYIAYFPRPNMKDHWYQSPHTVSLCFIVMATKWTDRAVGLFVVTDIKEVKICFISELTFRRMSSKG